MLGCVLAAAVAAQCRGAEPTDDPVAALTADADARHRDRLARFKGRSDVLVRPGVVADRKSGEIRIDARATGVGPHDPVEFLLISSTSGHDYEALAVAFAAAGHVDEALRFLGLPRGRGVDSYRMQFWPKGERVRVTVRLPSGRTVPLAHCVIDKLTHKPLPAEGFVFVGSRMVDDPQKPGQKRYAADLYDPRSIISIYNEADTVLDVPRRASQQEVYNRQFFNPGLALPTNRVLEIVLAPEYRDGTKRVIDLTLRVRRGTGGKGLLLGLAGRDGKLRVEGDFPAVLKEVQRLNRGGRDPFVSLDFSRDLPIGTIRKVCAVVGAAETGNGMRIEPPGEGELYYRAFLPREAYRNRETRMAQPWELRLERKKETVQGTLTKIEAKWKDDSLRPLLTLQHTPVPDPPALEKALQDQGPGLNVILVFVDPDFTYGELLRFVNPVRDTHPLIHVFLPAPPKPDSTPSPAK